MMPSELQSLAVESVRRRGFWDHGNLPPATRNHRLMAQVLRLGEEVGELSRAIRKGHWPDVQAEGADVYIVLAQIMGMLFIDLDDAVRAKLMADEQRGYLHREGDA